MLVADGEPVILSRGIYQLLEMITSTSCWRLGRAGDGGNLVVVAPGVVVPPVPIGVFPTVFLRAARVAGVVLLDLPYAENGPHRVFSVHEFGRDVEEVGCGPWSPASELVDERLIRGAISKGTHYVGVRGVGELILLLGEPPDVVPKAFPALLDTPIEVPRAPKAFVGALEIPDEGLPEVGPVVNRAAW